MRFHPANTFFWPASRFWNYRQFSTAFGIAFLLQALFLPCLCEVGTAKMTFALTLDLLIASRVGVAYLTRESDIGLRFYAWLLITSPAWITVAAYLMTGEF